MSQEPNDELGVRLPLTGFMLRTGRVPASSLTEASVPFTKWYRWSGASAEAIEPDDPALSENATTGDVILVVHSKPPHHDG